MARRPNPRAQAQRATAKRVREARPKGAKYRPILPRSIRAPSKQAQADYAYSVLNGETPYPPKNSAEGHQLARMASFSSKGKADPAFYAAFQQYFYHDEKKPDEPDEFDEYDYDDEDEDEE